jgi:hypothetical protein
VARSADELADRYNRQADEIVRLRQRLERLTERKRSTYNAAMAALPDGVSMTHDPETGHIWVAAGGAR